MNTLRHTSVVTQLENDWLDEGAKPSPIDRAWCRGWNALRLLAITSIREGWPLDFKVIPEDSFTNDAELRAYCRGRNAGVRHVQDVLRTAAALRELADAPAIATVDLGEEK